jgi:hypothetical protein
MSKSQILEKEESKADVDISKNKENLIESVVEETGMDTGEGREIVENTVNNMALDEEFASKKLEKDQISTSLVKDIINTIKSDKVITRGKIVNVDKLTSHFDGQKLSVKIKTHETNQTFTKEFSYSDDKLSEDLSKLFLLTDVESKKPSNLIGKRVPLNHTHQRNDRYDFNIHWPPKSGLSSKIAYKTNRIARKMRLVNLTGNDGYDFKYKPTIWSYVFTFLLFYSTEFIPNTFMIITLGLFSICLFCVLAVLSFVCFLEGQNYI